MMRIVLSFFNRVMLKELMMKKSGLIFMLLAGVAVMSTACTSSETTQAPETTQSAPMSSADQHQSAQTATVDPAQQGTAVEGDATIQQSQPAQATQDPTLGEQPSAQ
jgi:putative exporter of polyketide antibiotics